jgi:hypothetical protein
MENGVNNPQENGVKLRVTESDENYTAASVLQNSDGTKITLGNEKNAVETFWDGQTSVGRWHGGADIAPGEQERGRVEPRRLRLFQGRRPGGDSTICLTLKAWAV